MNRVELKATAKEMIKGNKWHIWKPIVIFGLCTCALALIAVLLDSAFGLSKTEVVEFANGMKATNTIGPITNVASIFISAVSCIFTIGYVMYMLAFVRGKKLTMNDIVDFCKKHWAVSLLTCIITGFLVAIGMILLIIPGIIIAVGLMFYQEVCADNPEMKAWDIVKKSWNMTKGHKMDLFVLGISFIGWCLLAGLTLGILYIWVYPYMIVTMTLAYEELKKAA